MLCVSAALGLLPCGSAWAQWGWTDSTGKKVFSDMPPPAEVPDSKVFSRPGGGTRPVASTPSVGPVGATSTTTAPSATPGGSPDKAAAELQAKKKQAEEAQKAKDQAKAKADELQKAKVRAETCQRAKDAMAALESGTPLRTMNAKGERVYMDENRRAAEKSRIQQAIQSNCAR